MRIHKFIVVILVGILVMSCRTDQDVTDANRARAEPVIEAIYDYEADHSSFPESLNDLVPKYLESLPSTTDGGDFFYSTDDLNGFILSFAIRSTQRKSFGCGYTNKARNWDCGYGD